VTRVACPRCGGEAEVRFYGPCDECRAALRAMGGGPREVEIAAYEPKANVVPNQVATKD
jgi:NMD protein affecting ribosome stability and mRNA decay